MNTANTMETQTEQNLNESHSVACGNDVQINSKTECATNTINSKTFDTGVDAIVKTNEMASQCAQAAKKEQRDQMCNTKVNTESQGCQKDTVGTSKQTSCLILKPEEINAVVDKDNCNYQDLPECFRCDGKGINKKGLPCKKCNGTGKLNNKFFKDLQKILADEVKKHCTQEYQKLLIKTLKDKKEAQAKVVH